MSMAGTGAMYACEKRQCTDTHPKFPTTSDEGLHEPYHTVLVAAESVLNWDG